MSTPRLLTRETVEPDALSTILRSELSACEAYRAAIHAIERGADAPALALRALYRYHRRLADDLRLEIRRRRGLPAEAQDPSEVWEAIGEGIAAMRGGPADFSRAVAALLRGERVSLEQARRAARDLARSGERPLRDRLAEGAAANIGLLEALADSVREAERVGA